MIDDVADYGGILGGAAALLVLGATLRGWFIKTLGRRRDRYRRLARLGPGAQLSFFTAVLGEPPAIRRSTSGKSTEMVRPGDPRFDPALVEPPDEDMHFVAVTRPYTESVYVDRDYYVQTISDEDETVVAFSVTTRSPRFAPCFEIPQRRDAWAPVLLQRLQRRRYRPLFRICLGRTRFSELGPGVRPSDDVVGPMHEANVGARFASYSETEYFGNPGYYQTYVFTAGGGAGHMRHFGDIVAVTQEVGYEWAVGGRRPALARPRSPAGVPAVHGHHDVHRDRCRHGSRRVSSVVWAAGR